jgi:uridine nucleosidase
MLEEKLPIPIWLDCDPGHDDAFAILLAAYSSELKVLGISIVHGNDTVHHCALNAKRFMWVCGIRGIPVYPGVTRPIVRDPKYCPEIHGVPG